HPPPCFINTCGAPVTVTYELDSAYGPEGQLLTPEECTFGYYCESEEVNGIDAFGPNAEAPPGIALDGSEVPSDGQSYATAYCLEMFGEGGPPPIQEPG
ncbi:MAG TPA: hypothetical protein VJ947_09615, partial [Pseudohaliea sp.]|nr:hypothetical protein [Pseudohaliea sp.]